MTFPYNRASVEAAHLPEKKYRGVRGWLFLLVMSLVVGGPMLWFVWPTLYRYDHIHIESSVFPVRIHRLTGKTEILFPNGWQERPKQEHKLLGNELAKLHLPQKFEWSLDGSVKVSLYNGSEWEIKEIVVSVATKVDPSKLLGKGKKDFSSVIHDSEFLGLSLERQRNVLSLVYPSSFAKLPTTYQNQMLSAIASGDADTMFSLKPLSRLYRLTGDAEPYGISEFSGKLGFFLSPDQTWDWSLVEATGVRR
jgi:hypothetical protein